MFRQTTLYFVSICLLSLLSFRHPYHVSVTSLHYSPSEKTLAVEIKIFYHDLEPAVNGFGGTQIDIKNHENTQQRDSLVFAYTEKHFEMRADGKTVTRENSSIGFQDEYILIRMFCNRVEGKTLSLKNTLCFEMESSQTNLFHFIKAEKKLTKKTVNPVAEASFSL